MVRGAKARLWTRNRNDISDRFPDIVAAVEAQLPESGGDGRLEVDSAGVAVIDELTRGPCDQISNGSRGV
ncbi:hypothetical protein E1218_03115 [Kribbella turkmenica]|uniref:Uncharacterized protein n=1 Tax=Kribbella turkmenica TaxID=2530375 RepID=A0A4R4XFS8_9ACTN|nr:hypothetical protein [Kribbella turkmenica]TDD29771.1 hypothetical protein E1218_03115 [Kribbella turkmenica]